MKKILLATALAAGAGQVPALTGNELLEHVRSSDRLQAGQERGGDAVKAGYSTGFIQGAAWAIDELHPRVCLPTGGTVGQHVSVVKQYLEQNPAQLHHPAHVLVREALQRAFPCR